MHSYGGGGYVTRDEFDRLQIRLDAIDAGGTRGGAVLAVQMQQISTELGRHEQQHEREARERAAGRRWLLMAVIAVIAAIDGPVVTVLLALHGR